MSKHVPVFYRRERGNEGKYHLHYVWNNTTPQPELFVHKTPMCDVRSYSEGRVEREPMPNVPICSRCMRRLIKNHLEGEINA
jgi:hypothetical protein